MPQCLSGHQNIIGSDGFVCLQCRAHRPRHAGIVGFESRDEDRVGEESLEALPIGAVGGSWKATTLVVP